jgi:hypothetical protein
MREMRVGSERSAGSRALACLVLLVEGLCDGDARGLLESAIREPLDER